MKTTRTLRVVLLSACCITLLGWMAPECTKCKRRAQRICGEHNIITAPLKAPGSANGQQSAPR